MSRARNIFFICLLLLPGITSAEPVSLVQALRETLANHPDLAIAKLSPEFSKTEQERIDGMLDPRVSARIAASDEKSPTTSPFAANQTQSGQFHGGITKPLEDGSTLTGSINYNRTKLNYPATVPTTFQSTLNPIYSHQIDLIYRYPLLRGHGNPAYHEMMQAAEQDEAASRWQVEMLKESLAGQVIAHYYQLAIEELRLEIADKAIARTESLLRYQRQREQFGLIEKADRLQAEALLATRRMDRSSAEAAVSAARIALNRLMFRDGANQTSPLGNEPIIGSTALNDLTTSGLVKEAVRKRPVFRSLEAKLAAAQARLSAAKDQHDTQLDLIGQIGSRALEDRPGRAVSQGFNLTDRYISFGIELSDTLGGKTTHAGIRQAELARQQVELEKIQATEALTTALSTTLQQLKSGEQTLRAANRRIEAETKKFAAEMKRYREGRSNTAAIIQFEGELQLAELQAAIQKTSLQLATQQLQLTRGRLLSEQLQATSASTGEHL